MGGLDWMCLIHDRNSWNGSLNMVISLEVLYKGISCSESRLISSHNGTGVTGINRLTPELNPSEQHSLLRFFTGNFKF
jgi:hypothetical protein